MIEDIPITFIVKIRQLGRLIANDTMHSLKIGVN